jgi:hypothetical protein
VKIPGVVVAPVIIYASKRFDAVEIHVLTLGYRLIA